MLYLLGSNHFQTVIKRYHKLWHKKTEGWAEKADKIILKVAEDLKLGIIPDDEDLFAPDEKLLVDEDDDEMEFNFGQLSTNSQSRSRFQVHDSEAFSAERELTNFKTQKNLHFQTCKFERAADVLLHNVY